MFIFTGVSLRQLLFSKQVQWQKRKKSIDSQRNGQNQTSQKTDKFYRYIEQKRLFDHAETAKQTKVAPLAKYDLYT